MHTASARLEAGPACTGARARGVLLAARATTSQRGLPVTPMAPADRGRLHDPACIGAKLSTSTRVQDGGGERALGRYMSLPVDKFVLLDPQLIHPLGGRRNRFLLSVPRINLLSVWLEPLVEVEVVSSLGRVSITSTSCRLRGSDLVQRLRLDERVAIAFATHLTWADGLPARPSARGAPDPAPAAPAAAGGALATLQSGAREWAARVSEALPGLGGGRPGGPADDFAGTINVVSEVTVWSEVVPPFTLMPREALEAAGNAVMAGVMRTLLPLFLRRLADDYQRWATEDAYRLSRMP